MNTHQMWAIIVVGSTYKLRTIWRFMNYKLCPITSHAVTSEPVPQKEPPTLAKQKAKGVASG